MALLGARQRDHFSAILRNRAFATLALASLLSCNPNPREVQFEPAFIQQEEPGVEKTIPSVVLQRIYEGHDPVAGWVELGENRYFPRLVSESTLDGVPERLLLIARFKADQESGVQEGGASGYATIFL